MQDQPISKIPMQQGTPTPVPGQKENKAASGILFFVAMCCCLMVMAGLYNIYKESREGNKIRDTGGKLLRKLGENCASDDQCLEGKCLGPAGGIKKCTLYKQYSEACTNDYECYNQNCTNNICGACYGKSDCKNNLDSCVKAVVNNGCGSGSGSGSGSGCSELSYGMCVNKTDKCILEKISVEEVGMDMSKPKDERCTEKTTVKVVKEPSDNYSCMFKKNDTEYYPQEAFVKNTNLTQTLKITTHPDCWDCINGQQRYDNNGDCIDKINCSCVLVCPDKYEEYNGRCIKINNKCRKYDENGTLLGKLDEEGFCRSLLSKNPSECKTGFVDKCNVQGVCTEEQWKNTFKFGHKLHNSYNEYKNAKGNEWWWNEKHQTCIKIDNYEYELDNLTIKRRDDEKYIFVNFDKVTNLTRDFDVHYIVNKDYNKNEYVEGVDKTPRSKDDHPLFKVEQEFFGNDYTKCGLCESEHTKSTCESKDISFGDGQKLCTWTEKGNCISNGTDTTTECSTKTKSDCSGSCKWDVTGECKSELNASISAFIEIASYETTKTKMAKSDTFNICDFKPQKRFYKLPEAEFISTSGSGSGSGSDYIETLEQNGDNLKISNIYGNKVTLLLNTEKNQGRGAVDAFFNVEVSITDFSEITQSRERMEIEGVLLREIVLKNGSRQSLDYQIEGGRFYSSYIWYFTIRGMAPLPEGEHYEISFYYTLRQNDPVEGEKKMHLLGDGKIKENMKISWVLDSDVCSKYSGYIDNNTDLILTREGSKTESISFQDISLFNDSFFTPTDKNETTLYTNSTIENASNIQECQTKCSSTGCSAIGFKDRTCQLFWDKGYTKTTGKCQLRQSGGIDASKKIGSSENIGECMKACELMDDCNGFIVHGDYCYPRGNDVEWDSTIMGDGNDMYWNTNDVVSLEKLDLLCGKHRFDWVQLSNVHPKFKQFDSLGFDAPNTILNNIGGEKQEHSAKKLFLCVHSDNSVEEISIDKNITGVSTHKINDYCMKQGGRLANLEEYKTHTFANNFDSDTWAPFLKKSRVIQNIQQWKFGGLGTSYLTSVTNIKGGVHFINKRAPNMTWIFVYGNLQVNIDLDNIYFDDTITITVKKIGGDPQSKITNFVLGRWFSSPSNKNLQKYITPVLKNDTYTGTFDASYIYDIIKSEPEDQHYLSIQFTGNDIQLATPDMFVERNRTVPNDMAYYSRKSSQDGIYLRDKMFPKESPNLIDSTAKKTSPLPTVDATEYYLNEFYTNKYNAESWLKTKDGWTKNGQTVDSIDTFISKLPDKHYKRKIGTQKQLAKYRVTNDITKFINNSYFTFNTNNLNILFKISFSLTTNISTSLRFRLIIIKDGKEIMFTRSQQYLNLETGNSYPIKQFFYYGNIQDVGLRLDFSQMYENATLTLGNISLTRIFNDYNTKSIITQNKVQENRYINGVVPNGTAIETFENTTVDECKRKCISFTHGSGSGSSCSMFSFKDDTCSLYNEIDEKDYTFKDNSVLGVMDASDYVRIKNNVFLKSGVYTFNDKQVTLKKYYNNTYILYDISKVFKVNIEPDISEPYFKAFFGSKTGLYFMNIIRVKENQVILYTKSQNNCYFIKKDYTITHENPSITNSVYDSSYVHTLTWIKGDTDIETQRVCGTNSNKSDSSILTPVDYTTHIALTNRISACKAETTSNVKDATNFCKQGANNQVTRGNSLINAVKTDQGNLISSDELIEEQYNNVKIVDAGKLYPPMSCNLPDENGEFIKPVQLCINTPHQQLTANVDAWFHQMRKDNKNYRNHLNFVPSEFTLETDTKDTSIFNKEVQKIVSNSCKDLPSHQSDIMKYYIDPNNPTVQGDLNTIKSDNKGSTCHLYNGGDSSDVMDCYNIFNDGVSPKSRHKASWEWSANSLQCTEDSDKCESTNLPGGHSPFYPYNINQGCYYDGESVDNGSYTSDIKDANNKSFGSNDNMSAVYEKVGMTVIKRGSCNNTFEPIESNGHIYCVKYTDIDGGYIKDWGSNSTKYETTEADAKAACAADSTCKAIQKITSNTGGVKFHLLTSVKNTYWNTGHSQYKILHKNDFTATLDTSAFKVNNNEYCGTNGNCTSNYCSNNYCKSQIVSSNFKNSSFVCVDDDHCAGKGVCKTMRNGSADVKVCAMPSDVSGAYVKNLALGNYCYGTHGLCSSGWCDKNSCKARVAPGKACEYYHVNSPLRGNGPTSQECIGEHMNCLYTTKTAQACCDDRNRVTSGYSRMDPSGKYTGRACGKMGIGDEVIVAAQCPYTDKVETKSNGKNYCRDRSWTDAVKDDVKKVDKIYSDANYAGAIPQTHGGCIIS